MKKQLIYVFIFLLTSSLVLAVTVAPDETSYEFGETANITVTDCTGTSTMKILNPNLDLVSINQGTGDWTNSYNTDSDSSSGEYSITLACGNDTHSSSFCVDSTECDGETETESTTTSPGGSSSHCTSIWTYSTWGKCNASLQQSRTLTDIECNEPSTTETQNCSQCEEDWLCWDWTECTGTQSRTCVDQSSCGTTFEKPDLTRNCDVTSSTSTETSTPPTQFAEPKTPKEPEQTSTQTQQPSFIKENLTLIMGGSSGLIFLVVLILIIMHFVHNKPVKHDINELRDWVQKERAMGTSDEDIKQILGQHTGWSDEEVIEVFK